MQENEETPLESSKIKVAIRIRPLLANETALGH